MINLMMLLKEFSILERIINFLGILFFLIIVVLIIIRIKNLFEINLN